MEGMIFLTNRMDQYRIERKLGSGTCTRCCLFMILVGSIFLVRSRKDGCMYALKQVRIGEDASSRINTVGYSIDEEVIHPSRESSINQYLMENATSQQQAFFVNMKSIMWRYLVRCLTN